MKPSCIILSISIAASCCSGQTTLIGPELLNGSFEADSGDISNNWEGVDAWNSWVSRSNPASSWNGQKIDAGAATEGNQVALIQGESAVYNLTSHIIAVGDEITYSWDFRGGGSGDPERSIEPGPVIASLAYYDEDLADIVEISSTESGPEVPGYAEGLSGSLTVQEGDAWVGKQLALVVINDSSSFLLFDNVQMSVQGGENTATWAGYSVDEDGDADTSDFLGWVNVNAKPFIYSYTLQQWLYVKEESVGSGGAWIFVMNF